MELPAFMLVFVEKPIPQDACAYIRYESISIVLKSTLYKINRIPRVMQVITTRLNPNKKSLGLTN